MLPGPGGNADSGGSLIRLSLRYVLPERMRLRPAGGVGGEEPRTHARPSQRDECPSAPNPESRIDDVDVQLRLRLRHRHGGGYIHMYLKLRPSDDSHMS